MKDSEEKLKKTPNLTLGDAASILACWSGIIALLYLGKDTKPIVFVIGLAVGYYLSKFIILKRNR